MKYLVNPFFVAGSVCDMAGIAGAQTLNDLLRAVPDSERVGFLFVRQRLPDFKTDKQIQGAAIKASIAVEMDSL